MSNHTLTAKGAAFSLPNLTRVDPNSTAGTGVALCSCGWTSDVLPSGRQRKEAHANHKDAILAESVKTPGDDDWEYSEPEGENTYEEAAPAPEPEPVVRKYNLDEMKDKIAKLLAKAEATDSQDERDAFTAKAEHLMIRLGIDAAELEAAGEVKPEDIVREVRHFDGNYSIAMIPFAYMVSLGYGNLQFVVTTYRTGLRRTANIIGHKSDVESFLVLLDSLSLQVMTALRKWQKDNIAARRGLTDMEKYLQHRSFITGYGDTCGVRLHEMRTVEEKTASTGAALVLVSKQARVDEARDQMYGNLKPSRGMHGSHVGQAAGRVAGQSANLGGSEIGGSKTSISS